MVTESLKCSPRISIHLVTFQASLAAVREAPLGLLRAGVFVGGKAAHLDFLPWQAAEAQLAHP